MSNSCSPMDCTCQAPLSIGFSRQEYWSGFSFPSPGDIPDPGVEPMSPAWQADSLPLSHMVKILSIIVIVILSKFMVKIVSTGPQACCLSCPPSYRADWPGTGDAGRQSQGPAAPSGHPGQKVWSVWPEPPGEHPDAPCKPLRSKSWCWRSAQPLKKRADRSLCRVPCEARVCPSQ